MKPLTLLSAIALLLYPFGVYYGLNRWGVGVIAGGLALLFLLRVIGASQTRLRELKYIAWVSGAAGLVLTLLAFVFKSSDWFTYYPVIVNLFMFLLFAQSLWQKESMIERFARLQEPELPDYAIHYTRNVTKVWCLFFILNGSAALVTSFMSLQTWAFYNGLLSYLLAGGLFAVEFVVRIWVKRKNEKAGKNVI
ncbi:MAG: DNA gyrase subunit B [Psychromonas sp.]|nr:DNA gyrase subunit B [Psychromonas sp.]